VEEVVRDYPVRVLHVVSKMTFGGVQSVIMNYYRHIDRSKVQFDFAVQSVEKCEYDDEINALGGRIHRISPLHIDRKRFSADLKSLLRNNPEYRIIHSHQNFMNIIPLSIAKKCNVPIRISHSHNNYKASSKLKEVQRIAFRRVIRHFATECLACSQPAGRWLYGSSFGKHINDRVVHNAINTNLFRFDMHTREKLRQSLGIEDKFVLIHIGMFSKQKNHLYLLEVFSEFHKITPESVLLLIGDGKERNLIEERIDRLGLKKEVIVLGVRRNVHDYLQAADAFVFPSLHEGLPVVVVEAQTSGLPCFVSSEAVPEEVDLNNDVKFLSIKLPPSKWAEAIVSTDCLQDRTNAYQRTISGGYDVDKEAEKLMEFYLEKSGGC